MEDVGTFLFGVLIGMVVLALSFGVVGVYDQYEEGQIDALSGRVYYKLVKEDDSYRWKYCGGLCYNPLGE